MTRDIIVIGGSAGSVEAMLSLAQGLPADLPASIFVVIHTAAGDKSALAGLIDRAGPLRGIVASDRLKFRPGTIYLPAPDQHLLVEDSAMRVVRGPRENRHRPAIDPLFRSAAVECGSRVVGVALSGVLDDGAAGLSLVKTPGGVAVVQHPDDAQFPDMPKSALEAVEADHVVPLRDMPQLLSWLVREEIIEEAVKSSDAERAEAEISKNRLLRDNQMREVARPSVFSCPDCGGILYEYEDKGPLRFRCAIGHGYGGKTQSAAQSEQFEEALAASSRSLVEKIRLYDHHLEDFNRRDMGVSAAEMSRKAEEARRHLEGIRSLLPST